MSDVKEKQSTQLNKARQALVDRVLARLDEGAMPWDDGMLSRVKPFNAVSGTQYRGINVLNLILAGKKDPRWLTFNQATAAGYQVKKGAKGVPIELYKTIDKRTGKEADIAAIKEEIKDMTFLERQEFKRENLQTFARSYYVFNASDVNGIEPYQAPTLSPADISARNERIERVIEDSQALIFYDGRGRNYYSPVTDEIHLTDRAAFKSDEFFYNTALHEMAHSTGHSSRLNRPGGRKGTPEYAKEELVAEISSVLTAAELGLNHSDRVIENSAEYVRSWAQSIRQNPQVLIDAAFDASRATDYVCDAERKREIEKRQFLQAWEATPEIERRAVKDELLHMERMDFINDDTHGRERLAWVREYEAIQEKTQEKSSAESRPTLLVNCYAGPGAGKTTCALELTAALKKRGLDVEYVPEYAKELVYSNDLEKLSDQEHVTDTQYERLVQLKGKVDVIITDSPVLLGQVYGKDKISAEYNEKIVEYYRSFNNFNLFIQRGEDYQQTGRLQSREEAVALDEEIKQMLARNKAFYGKYDQNNVDKIAHNIEVSLQRLRTDEKHFADVPKKKTQEKQESKGAELNTPRTFAEQVDAVFARTFPKNDAVLVLPETPELLQKVGLRNLKIMTTQKHIINANLPEGNENGDDQHGLSIDLIKGF